MNKKIVQKRREWVMQRKIELCWRLRSRGTQRIPESESAFKLVVAFFVCSKTGVTIKKGIVGITVPPEDRPSWQPHDHVWLKIPTGKVVLVPRIHVQPVASI